MGIERWVAFQRNETDMQEYAPGLGLQSGSVSGERAVKGADCGLSPAEMGIAGASGACMGRVEAGASCLAYGLGGGRTQRL